MLRVIGLLVLLTAACTAELAPDDNGSTAPSASQLGPHLGMTMTPAIKACREGCWATTPFGACAQQRDACLKTASGADAQHACRQSSYACGQTRRQCMEGCWAEDPEANPNRPEVVAAKPHLGMTMTPEIKACRQTCWSQIPFDECANQRDTCLATASDKSDRRHCKKMSLTCRNMRTSCLRGCWGGAEPDPNPLGLDNTGPGEQVEQTAD